MDLKDIKAIIDLMKKNSISEFELEKEDFKIRLRRGGVGPVVQVSDETAISIPMPAGATAPASSAVLTGPLTSTDVELKSPMIGTYYHSPSPESGPYVEVGTEVTPDSVVCIIEAMKVMNEIKAEMKGVITEILIENAKPVEFGQPIYKIRPT